MGFFSSHAEATWNLSVKIGKQLVNYANISIIMEPFPRVCNIEFVPKIHNYARKVLWNTRYKSIFIHISRLLNILKKCNYLQK